MRNAVSVQQKLVFPFLKKGDVTLSPLKSIFRSHARPPLQLFFIRGRVLIQGVHHEHHIWPRWDRGVTRPHDFKAQEAERLQERSYQREGNPLPSGIILCTCVALEATTITPGQEGDLSCALHCGSPATHQLHSPAAGTHAASPQHVDVSVLCLTGGLHPAPAEP